MKQAALMIIDCALQDDFDPWPPRLVVQTSHPSAEAVAALPAPVAAVLLRHSKLGASGLEILEFDGMDTLRLVARRLAEELGAGASSPSGIRPFAIVKLLNLSTCATVTFRSRCPLCCRAEVSGSGLHSGARQSFLRSAP